MSLTLTPPLGTAVPEYQALKYASETKILWQYRFDPHPCVTWGKQTPVGYKIIFSVDKSCNWVGSIYFPSCKSFRI